MPHAMWTKISVIMIAVIFGSGFLIWGYNRIYGRDLSQPPEFDITEYYNLNWPTPAEFSAHLIEQMEKTDPDARQQLLAEQLAEKARQNLELKNAPLAPHSIYFSNYFQGQNSAQTRQSIADFLVDFPALSVNYLEDLQARKCYLARLPVDGRQAIIQSLLDNPVIESAAAPESGSPDFSLCFTEPYYLAQVKQFLAAYPAVEPVEAPVANSQYVARLPFRPDILPQLEAAQKIRTDYADVIKVAE